VSSEVVTSSSHRSPGAVAERVRAASGSLPPAEARVVQALLLRGAEVIHASVTEIAAGNEEAARSDATSGVLVSARLFWGVLGALVMRLTMIFIGASLINRFHWIIYIFGAFLVYTGIKMFTQENNDFQPEDNALVRLATRIFPIERSYDEKRFFTRKNGKLAGTLLLLVLLIVEVADLVFAVDSIPAIFAITTNAFIVYTSNVFAILGLRSMYFLLAGVVEKFHYLKIGLAIVLTFIGAKMLIVAVHINIPIWISLVFVAVVLLSSVAASLVWAKHADTNIEVDLPEDFDSPFEDEEDTEDGKDKKEGE